MKPTKTKLLSSVRLFFFLQNSFHNVHQKTAYFKYVAGTISCAGASPYLQRKCRLADQGAVTNGAGRCREADGTTGLETIGKSRREFGDRTWESKTRLCLVLV